MGSTERRHLRITAVLSSIFLFKWSKISGTQFGIPGDEKSVTSRYSSFLACSPGLCLADSHITVDNHHEVHVLRPAYFVRRL